MNIFSSKSRGVTLVELSIVLAILGILIVATISGKSLIDISRATATIQQLRDRGLAFQVFASSYDCLPGDCIDATTKIKTVSTGINGNGDGIINLASATTSNELAFVEHHLIESKLFNRTITLPTSGAQTATANALQFILPKVKIPTAFISNISVGNVIYSIVGALSQANATTSDIINSTSVSSAVLQIVDSKYDDAVASTGTTQCLIFGSTYTVPTDGIFLTPSGSTTVAGLTIAADYTVNCVMISKVDF